MTSRSAAQAMATVERLADQVQLLTTRRVRARPQMRRQWLARVLWAEKGEHAVENARSAGVDLADQLVGSPGPRTSLGEYHEAALLARVAALRSRGVEVVRVDGRWIRPSRSANQSWTPVETLQMLAQARLYRAELEARKSSRRLARTLGIAKPIEQVNGRSEWTDPRLQEHHARLTAVAAGRIAHDVAVDAFRDAVFEQVEQRPEVIGWRRLAEPTACGACLALANGRIETSRRFYRHTRCRCIPVPVTATSPPLPTGRELFDALSEEQQDAIFRGRGGREKAQALRDGRIDLADLIQVDEDRLDNTDYVITETPMVAIPT